MSRYYLLLKKQNAGKLDQEELDILESKHGQKSRSAEKSPQPFSSNLSFLQNVSQAGSTSSQRSASRDREGRPERGLPLLNPQLNINDITYSIKEKITISTAPNKKLAGTTNNFNIYINRSSREDSPAQPLAPSFSSTLKEPRRPDREQLMAPPAQPKPKPAGSGAPGRDSATKSFDLEKNATQASQFYQTGKKFKTTLNADALQQELKKSPSVDAEPKSRKLLEMMLKRLSKIETEDEPSYGTRSRQTPSHKAWDNKSGSTEQHRKKPVYTLPPDNHFGSRPSSRERPAYAHFEALSHSGASGQTGAKAIVLKNNKQIQIKNWRVRNPLGTGN